MASDEPVKENPAADDDEDREVDEGDEGEAAAEQAAGDARNAETAGASRPALPSRRATPRWQIALGVFAVAGGAVAGLSYKSYADTWLRQAKAPRCALAARVYLKVPTLSSGTEPHDTPDGQTVYLTEAEDRAVRCAKGISPELGTRFVGAFAEVEPERRALELLKIVRDTPKDKEHDRDAAVAFFLASAALQPLPDLPEKKAASDEMDQAFGCRFETPRIKCPSRPPIPWIVWVLGVPSALGVVTLAGLGAVEIAQGASRLVRRRRQRAGADKDKGKGAKPAQRAGADEDRGKGAKPAAGAAPEAASEAKPAAASKRAEPSIDGERGSRSRAEKPAASKAKKSKPAA